MKVSMTPEQLDELEAHAEGRLLTGDEARESLLEVIGLLRKAKGQMNRQAFLLAREARNDAWAALANMIRRCQYNCSRAAYCGTCEVAIQALPEGYDLDHSRPCSTHGCDGYEVYLSLCERCLPLIELNEGGVVTKTWGGR